MKTIFLFKSNEKNQTAMGDENNGQIVDLTSSDFSLCKKYSLRRNLATIKGNCRGEF